MDVEDALYHVVHDYKGGAESLAPRMGLASSTLQSMASPKIPTHGWSLRRFRQVIALADDLRPLHALCEEFGGVFIQTAGFKGLSDTALLETMTKLGKEFGDVCQAMHAALADSKVSEREVAEFRQQLYELNQAGAEALNRLEQLKAPGTAG